ncbi:MAG: hypothetical protein MUF71_06015 [Candidatus Kapabacteria bacterium]|jgi:hypothetical protein|nr:hypothetical protein [Candidatus Kapabacteria bacterium]
MNNIRKVSQSLVVALVTVVCSRALVFAQSTESGGGTTMQEQRVTERRTVTDEDGKVSRTSAVIETKIENIAPPTRHLIYAAPVRMIWMANIGYMRAISNTFAFGGNIDIPTAIDSRVQSGFGISVEGRYYPGGNGLRGFYLAPGLNFHSFQAMQYSFGPVTPTMPNPRTTPTQVTATPFSVAAIGGWVFNWGDLSLDFGLGFKAHLISGTPSNTATFPVYYGGERGVGAVGFDSFSGTMPVFRVNVGYSW